MPGTERQASSDSVTTQSSTEDLATQTVAKLKAELKRQRHYLESLEIDRQQYRMDNRALTERISQMRERLQQRQEDQKQLQKNYNEHLRSLRATDDDLTSIGKKLKWLKQLISELADDLLDNVDPVRATLALRGFWLNLGQSIERMGSPLPLNRIRMLTEKYMMDFLMQNMTPNVFPGLSVHKEYTQLELWLRSHDRHMATRLRQEMALVILSDKDDIRKSLQKAAQTHAHTLYNNLKNAYPYMHQYDKSETDPSKRYETKVRQLVDHSVELGFAMKGQEVDIVATVVEEGSQPYNPALMVEEDGLKSGIIEFCVCPPFVVFDTACTILEKGRVLCSPASSPANTRA